MAPHFASLFQIALEKKRGCEKKGKERRRGRKKKKQVVFAVAVVAHWGECVGLLVLVSLSKHPLFSTVLTSCRLSFFFSTIKRHRDGTPVAEMSSSAASSSDASQVCVLEDGSGECEGPRENLDR